jgi:hypothetical protein
MFSQWRKVRLAQLGTEHHRIMHEMTFAAPIGVSYVGVIDARKITDMMSVRTICISM